MLSGDAREAWPIDWLFGALPAKWLKLNPHDVIIGGLRGPPSVPPYDRQIPDRGEVER
jgi:hypothetical protein